MTHAKTISRQKRLTSLDIDNCEQEIKITDPTPLPEQLLEMQKSRQQIWQALQQLPPNQYASVVLRYYLEMPEREIAEKLQGPVGTVKWWLYSAKQRLARLLALDVDKNK